MATLLKTLQAEWTNSAFSLDHPGGLPRDPKSGRARRRVGTALCCRCPCGCGSSMIVPFTNPLDGGPVDPPHAWGDGLTARWFRVGDNFNTLSLTPSILLWADKAKGVEHWHGYITNGVVTP